MQNDLAESYASPYQPHSYKEASTDWLKLLEPMLNALLKGELDHHLGYNAGTHDLKPTDNRRNGYSPKSVRTSRGKVPVKIPRDRFGTYIPAIVPKRKRDVSDIEDEVMAMYAQQLTRDDIALILNDLYDAPISDEQVDRMAHRIFHLAQKHPCAPKRSEYPMIFVDEFDVATRSKNISLPKTVYVLMGCPHDGHKEILGLWITKRPSVSFWQGVFDQLKEAGIRSIGQVNGHGIPGLEEGVLQVFPQTMAS